MTRSFMYYAVAGPSAKQSGSQPILRGLARRFLDKDLELFQKSVLDLQKPRRKLEKKDILYYKLKSPEDWLFQDISTGMKKLPSDEAVLRKYAYRAQPKDLIEEFTPGKMSPNYINFIVWLPDITPEKILEMQRLYPELMRAATVRVGTYGFWTMSDVVKNGGVFVELSALEEDHPVKHLQRTLDNARICKEDDLINANAVYYVAELRRQISSNDSCNSKSKDAFETYFHVPETDVRVTRAMSLASKTTILSIEEFETFASVRTFSKNALADSQLTTAKRNSSDLAASFTTCFVRPPCQDFLRSDVDDEGNPTGQYWVEHKWNFSIYLTTQTGDFLDVRTYQPNSDFRLDAQGIFPIIVGEVVSEPNKNSDEYRMLIQLFAILAIGSQIITRGELKLVLMAIYLDTGSIARRYLLYRKEGEGVSGEAKVEIVKEIFDLKDAVQGRKLLLQIHNYLTYMQSLELTEDGIKKLEKLTEEGRNLRSLNSSINESKKDSYKKSRKESKKKATKLDVLEEETEESEADVN